MKSRQSAAGKIGKQIKFPLKHHTPRSPTVEDQAEASNGLRDHIASRAYALYEERGYRHGCDLQDWLDAEREILSRQLAV